jgi:hypothetical protein
MSGKVFVRAALYGVVLGSIDAVSGRTLQASPEPSALLALAVTAWVTYGVAEAERRMAVAFVAGMTLWASYFATFAAVAQLLVGWNDTVPWQPRSGTWLASFATTAVVVALLTSALGARNRSRRRTVPVE